MNKDLLLKVADAIEANPEHFDMENWFQDTACGTAACIGGWALHLHKQKKSLMLTDKYFTKAINPVAEMRRILKLPHVDFEALTLVGQWENVALRRRYYNAQTPKTKAKAAAEYVRWFVENAEAK